MSTGPARWESAIDAQIRMAQERGDFDDLPGKGKPLAGLDGPDDEMWWIRGYLRREGLSGDALLPPSIQLRKELDNLAATLHALPTEPAVRTAVRELNVRVAEFLRAPTPPRVRVGPVDVEEAVRRWRDERKPADRRDGDLPPPLDSPTPRDSVPARTEVAGPDSWWRRIRGWPKRP